MSEFTVHCLLRSATATVRDISCNGSHQGRTPEEAALETQLVFPYRGIYVRHLGHDDAVAEVNQVLLFNADEGYQVSHPVAGGDASLTVSVSASTLGEIASPRLLKRSLGLAFRQHRLRIDPRAQVLVTVLRHALHRDTTEPLEADGLALTLVHRALGPRTTHEVGATAARRRLVDRAKIVLASEPARRWTLAEVAAELSCSPVYLTQTFQKVEGLPLYHYQMRLRLAQALHKLAEYDDLTSLGLDLGFSSHSHFSAAFRRLYGHSPTEFRRLALQRDR
ncbi:MAG TPA: AraC family transcriptional regulator [Candidatus Acidoferrales bacterium]|nr:AraC family transcriptional regulator [Candidatus Acidoferrales bacterium]